MSQSTPAAKGIIGRSFEQGMRVVWSFVDELPDESTRQSKPWLAVVSWPYDGSTSEGMPDEALQASMRGLEEALYPLEDTSLCFSAYRRTGNGLKEIVFYVGDRDMFMKQLNDLLAEHPRYPLEIKFYEDRGWSDFEKLISDFRKPNQSPEPTRVGVPPLAAQLQR